MRVFVVVAGAIAYLWNLYLPTLFSLASFRCIISARMFIATQMRPFVLLPCHAMNHQTYARASLNGATSRWCWISRHIRRKTAGCGWCVLNWIVWFDLVSCHLSRASKSSGPVISSWNLQIYAQNEAQDGWNGCNASQQNEIFYFVFLVPEQIKMQLMTFTSQFTTALWRLRSAHPDLCAAQVHDRCGCGCGCDCGCCRCHISTVIAFCLWYGILNLRSRNCN